jgi:hypothetical protein
MAGETVTEKRNRRIFYETATLAVAEGSVFFLIYSGASASNAKGSVLKYSPGGFQVLQNGEIVLLTASVLSFVVGSYGLSEKEQMLAAGGITEGAFFLVGAIVSVLVRFMRFKNIGPSSLTSIAQVKLANAVRNGGQTPVYGRTYAIKTAN